MDDLKFSNYLPANRRQWAAVTTACAGLLWIFGDDLGVQIQWLRSKLRDSVRENVSIEFEIERARKSAASLFNDIRRNHEIIVREQVEVDELSREIQREKRDLDDQRAVLVSIRSQIPAAESMEPSADRTAAWLNARRELRTKFATLQTAEATLAARTQMLQIRQDSLAQAKAAQRDILQRKRQLDTEVANLDARLRLLNSKGISDQVRVDRESLEQSEELVLYLRRRLAVAEQLTNAPADFYKLQVNEGDVLDADLESDVDRYLTNESNSRSSGSPTVPVTTVGNRQRE